MKEITRIYTAQITEVVKPESDADADMYVASAFCLKERFKEFLKEQYHADDVICDVQVFIMDGEEDDNDEKSGNSTIERGRTI